MEDRKRRSAISLPAVPGIPARGMPSHHCCQNRTKRTFMLSDIVDHDAAIIARCVSGSDESAWAYFVSRYSRLIWGAIHKTFKASSYAYTLEDAEDLYGAFFLSLVENDFQKLRQFQSRNACSLSTWLTVVTVRMTIDHMRRQSARPRAAADPAAALLAEVIADGARNAEQLLMDAQQSASIARSLAGLSGLDREIYDLLYVKGVSPVDAARAMGITTAAIYTRKHRLIERLKQSLTEL
jgi:RNA polymerase sigma factor (sigma-70 family)